MTNDKKTIQDIINQIEVSQKEALRKNKSEKNKKVVNLQIFRESLFNMVIAKEALKNERKKLAERGEDETNK